MKVVILAGGYGTRISEESVYRPKPMVQIGGMPIMWHIMKSYSYYGFNDFIICAGYKQEVIKEFFYNYYIYHSDATFNLSNGSEVKILNNKSENWNVTVVDTGTETLTGGRIKRIKQYIDDNEFFLTYGDGVSDVNIKELLSFHRSTGKHLTITTVQPGNHYGSVAFDEDGIVNRFAEKKSEDGGWINGGFMVSDMALFDFIEGDKTVLEKEPFESLVNNNQMAAYKHEGFWQSMDTLRDKMYLENLIASNQAPWMVWENR